LKNSLSKDFKFLTTINKRIIVNIFNYSGENGQAGVKPDHLGITPGTRQSLNPGGISAQL